MKSVYDFIIEPIGKVYDNSIHIEDQELVLNTSIEKHKFVNNRAKVISTPLAFYTPINIGDEVIVHHNIFRRYYDMKGKEKNSSKFFKENWYFCQVDQVYLYKRLNTWKAFGDRCFVMPLKNDNDLELEKEKKLIGILKYGNKSLEDAGISEKDVVGFTPNSEFEFIINGDRLYCMKSNDIVIKYEQPKNKTEYNPSWAQSG
tara:strand:+ start:745 stop:1350 length:606 start_codon:yes stop_codon:yes gene_type:complete